MNDKRVQFDFEIVFANGGGLEGRGFRLDIEGDSIDDDTLSQHLVRDLRLLMVDRVNIRDKRIIAEPHKRMSGSTGPDRPSASPSIIDLSHPIEHGMITYKGLPAPVVCDFLDRVKSRAMYAQGTEFHIGRIDMVANTGTYIDSPFHRYADGIDVAALPLAAIANVPAIVVNLEGMAGRAIGRHAFAPYDVRGKAVLIRTGWASHWRTDRYFEGHPYLTSEAATALRDAGAVLVGIDSYNIDDTSDGRRPVHTVLLGAGIPIVEHLRSLENLPSDGFRFTAVPAPVRGMGTFPVRAFASWA